MGKSYDGKKRWNETVRQTAAALAAADSRRGKHGAAGKKKASDKRVSGRAVKLSAAMKFVDEDTRLLVRSARLEALEADNYGVEAEQDPDAAGDELYVDDEDFAQALAVDKKTAKGRRRASSGSSAPKIKRFKVKSLAQLVFEEFGGDREAGSGRIAGQGGEASKPSYLSVAAGPSTLPPRKFCVVCGFFAPYACRRCGSRFCRVKCGDHHKESGCLKFGL